MWDVSSLFRQIKPWLRHLAVLGFATIVLAALFSSPWFLTPLFQSQARIYPTNTDAFSEESESEQMLEIIQSTDIKRKMIQTFGLMERYRINSGARYANTHVLRQYNKYVVCSKTRFETIEISVMDADPEVACAMVDSLIAFYNDKMLSLRRERYALALQGYQHDLVRKQSEIDSLNKRMENYRHDFGILDYGSQTHQLTLGYAEVLARGAARSSVEDLQKRLDLLAAKGGEFWQMQNLMNELIQQRDQCSKLVEETFSLVSRRDNFALVVQEAFPADKKAYPVRWLIVLGALASTELLALVLVFLLGAIRSNS